MNAQAIVLSRSAALGVTKWANASYSVKLRVLPTADMVVEASSSDGTAARDIRWH